MSDFPVWLSIAAFLIVVALVFLYLSVRVVNQYEKMIVLRLGKTNEGLVRDPGLRFLVPVIDQPRKVDLRETFGARGHVSVQGSFRQWTNGNLQALLEPTSTGQRLRIRTFKGSAQSFVLAGLGTLGAGCVLALVSVLTEGASVSEALLRVVGLMVAGGGLLGMAAVQLPSWARLRRRQMEEVLARLAQAVAEPVSDRLPPSRSAAED